MTMNFANADSQNDFSEILPHGALSWAILNLRPFNLDQGLLETPSKPPKTSKFLNFDVTMFEGPWDKRKVFAMIGVAGSEAYINMGRSAIKAILECGNNAGPHNPDGGSPWPCG